MAGRVYILTEWPRIKMTSEVLFQHKEKRCPQNRNDTFKQILKAWIMLQKKIATERYLSFFFFLSNSVFQQRHFSNTLSKNAGVISPLLFFLPHCPAPPHPTRYLKAQVYFNAFQSLSHESHKPVCLCKLEMDEISHASVEQLQIIKAEMKKEYCEKTILTSSCST